MGPLNGERGSEVADGGLGGVVGTIMGDKEAKSVHANIYLERWVRELCSTSSVFGLASWRLTTSLTQSIALGRHGNIRFAHRSIHWERDREY